MITEINLDQEQDQAVAKKLAQLSRLSRYINDAVDGLVPVLMTMNGSNPITADGKLRKKYAAVRRLLRRYRRDLRILTRRGSIRLKSWRCMSRWI